jgi:hypothetical protein
MCLRSLAMSSDAVNPRAAQETRDSHLFPGGWQVKAHRVAVWSFVLVPRCRDSWPARAFPLGLAYPRAPHSRRRATHGNNAVAPTVRATRLALILPPTTYPANQGHFRFWILDWTARAGDE